MGSGSKRFVNTYRMTARGPKGRRNRGAMLGFWQFWKGIGQGKFWKRQHSKAQRSAWKNELRGHKPRKSASGSGSECQYKGW